MNRERPSAHPNLLPEQEAQIRLDISHVIIEHDATISFPTFPLMQRANGSTRGDYNLTLHRLISVLRAWTGEYKGARDLAPPEL